ncbi:DedA family protein [Streptomyces europaeiscabiei]|uniref:VTT domain-containing protein n=1 Tax=Streptomyces europaeiscabiei TaxID=146819 RepID=A0ABU4NSU8_9ACTN|nr:VTT domain-containing protein [Streptomyces europaeiscabiei]MDX3548987.1 VTT domain-containing protein [Streptomyces europaeiscabiei]MDX3555408.1 VTT domain-containing protein [Streptomyces europaeiscabiei]MDX3668411.1 VTT domain-containing protein [Streptomyces europaeiscabiei]MDX3706143.1 VTT domain-containing protein [Streptomyces europaeiscabiei]MDX3777858.1 VTT domain-containing protein [Streptomyces europaeiscabiei]
MTTIALGPSWLDPDYLLDSFGIWGLLLIVFAESGLLIGFFLPGDSLLFTAGMLIATDVLDFPLWAAIVLICVSAIVGDQVGYMFGKKVGPALFKRPDSRLFKQENVTKAHEFFEKHGPKSLVLARFVPIVRTFTPIIAGVSGMRYRTFLIFNVVGGILWGAGVTLLGSWLGKIEFVRTNIEAMLLLIVLISVLPIIVELLKARKAKKNQPQQSQQAPAAPVMDDATTQLRRIPPTEPQQQPYDPNQGYDNQGYDNQGYQQQGYQQQGHQQQGHQDYGYQQPQQQPYAQQYPQGNQYPPNQNQQGYQGQDYPQY